MRQIPLHWNFQNNQLVRVFIFRNFIECVHFITKISSLAESAEHHPEIQIFKYKHVKVVLTTHDAENTVTEKDILLAEMIDEEYKRL